MVSFPHMMRRVWFLPALALALLAGCGAGAPPPAPTADGTPAAPDGTPASGVAGIVTRIVERITVVTRTPDPADAPAPDPAVLDLTLSGGLPNLDPSLAESDAQLDLAQNLFIGLTRFNADNNRIEPELAIGWEIGPDGRTWTFYLRDDVNWVRPRRPPPGSDALWSAEVVRPVTADDVVFAIRRLCSREIDSAQAFSLFIIEGCEAAFTTLQPTDVEREAIAISAPNPTTLVVRLTQPGGYFLTVTSMPLFRPVPGDLVEEFGDEWLNAAGELSTGWQTPDNLVTSGAFMLVPALTTSQSAVLHRNPLWPVARPGNVEVVNVQFLDDEMDAFELWNDRTIDIAPLPPSEREAFMKRTPDKARLIPDRVLFYIAFDFGSQVFREPEVRRAFSAAIDRQRLVDEIFDGNGLPMRHASIPGVVAAIPTDEVGVGYSPDYARQQMAESTFRSCRLMPEVRMLVSSADLSLQLAELIRDMWVEELGCMEESIAIEQVQFGELLAGTRRDALGRPDLWELAWAPAIPDTYNMLNTLLHCEDSENRQNRDCSEPDTLLRRAAVGIDPAQRTELYREVEGQFFNDRGIYPIAPLYIQGREIVIQNWIKVTPVAFGGQQWDRVTIDAALKTLERSR